MQKLLLSIMLLTGIALKAQDFKYRLMDPIETSPSVELRCIYFDSQGLMWLGTNSGLKAYDGYVMRTYRSDAFSPGILPNNTVLCITEDHHHCLWLGTRNGLVRMNRRTGEFRTFFLPRENQHIIYTLYTSRDGTIWIGTDYGLSRFVPETQQFYTYDASNSWQQQADGRRQRLAPASVKSIVEDPNGDMLIGTWAGGLMRFRRGRNIFCQYPKLNERNSAYSLHFDKRGRLWIGTWGYGLIRMDSPAEWKTPKIVRYPYRANYFDTFYKVIEDPVTHTLWACSREGISMVDADDPHAQWKHITSAGGRIFNFSNDIATDGRGNIWITTLNHGIVHVNTNPSPFRTWHLNTSGYPFVINAVTTIFTENGQQFWIGMNPYGLAYYDRQSERTLFNHDIPGFSQIDAPTLGAKFSSFVRRSNGELWMANNSYGIIIKRPGQDAFRVSTDNVNYISDNFINVLFESTDHVMWVGQRSGLSVVDRNDRGTLLRLREGPNDFTRCDVRSIMEDRQGNIWIATENAGIVRISGNPLNPATLKYKQYNPGQGNFAVDDATACYQDTHGRLWAISNSGGLFLYDKAADRFVPMNKVYHIDGNRALSINEDAYGNIWLTTDDALIRLSFDRSNTASTTNFSKEDGISDLLFYPNATFRYGNELYFGGRTSFLSFIPPRQVNPQERCRSRLIITDILIDDTPFGQIDSTRRARISAQTPAFTRQLTIPASVRKVAIEFALLTYVNTLQNKYAYLLEGYDDEWHYAPGTARRATYQNLPSGTYRFRLKSADNYGRWKELPYALTIRILPPWYASWWAFMIYILLLISALYGGIWWYDRHLKTLNRLHMAVILTNITHELLTPLTVIAATIELLRNQTPQHEDEYGVMQNNINRITMLLRQILEVRKSQAGQLKLQVSHNNLSAIVREACENIRPIAVNKDNKLTTDFPQRDIEGWFDPDKLDKMLYNLLSNAFKYNKVGGQVSVSLKGTAASAVISVADEGIGIPPEKMKHLYSRFLDGDYRKMHTTGTGIGLSLTRDLARLHHGDIKCQSLEGQGTTFTITLPIARNAYTEQEIDSSREKKTVERETVQQIATATSTQKRDGTKQTSHRHSILIVEDNEELLQLMKQLLGKQYNIHTAKNGTQALNIIYKQQLDLVVSDVMMPVMDGIELTQRIKHNKDFAQLPVILLTARTKEEDRHEAYALGADDYIVKPFSMDELELRISNIIENRRRIRERFAQPTEPDPHAQHYSNPDDVFIQHAKNCVMAHLDDTDYDRERFAKDMLVSSSTLYNKLRALTGLSVSGFINAIRMQEAIRIAKSDPDIPISELSERVGFNSPKYFTYCFKKEYGMLFKDYIEHTKDERGTHPSAADGASKDGEATE